MTMKQSKTISLFDKYSLVIPPELDCYEDGPLGRRVVFLSDPEKTFTISFEEGMKMLDMVADHPEEKPLVRFQCCKDGKYIHQIRSDPETRPGIGNYAFFHMEIPDETGELHILPGQMTAPCGYTWTDGVEPILLDLMNGLTVCNPKGGGCD